MPNLLRTLFRPGNRRRRSPSPSASLSSTASPSRTPAQTPDVDSPDVDSLAAMLRDQLGTGGAADDAVRELLLRLDGASSAGAAGSARASRGSQISQASGAAGRAGAAGSSLSSRPGRPGRPSSFRNAGRQDYALAVQACEGALADTLRDLAAGESDATAELVARIAALLEAELVELRALGPYADGRALPALHTLVELYQTAARELAGAARAADPADALAALADVLDGGPAYLVDVAIVEAVIWHAEIIDARFGADIRDALYGALAERADLAGFRVAARRVARAAAALPVDELDDDDAREAYAAVGELIGRLQARTRTASAASSRVPSKASGSVSAPASDSPAASAESASAASAASAASGAPGTSAASSTGAPRPGSFTPKHRLFPTPTPDSPSMQSMTASEIVSRFGTGAMPTPSSTPLGSSAATPRAPPSPSPSSASAASAATEQEVWEYRGQLLTRSALSLVLRQEALAAADSGGQYVGDVSWDDVRAAWVPRWAEKLKKEDVAAGAVPSTNPADFKVKTKDAWGNKIGWYNGAMYYEEEPSFELRE